MRANILLFIIMCAFFHNKKVGKNCSFIENL